ncbi:MAG: rhomboid family intramembrane serine protease [Opitutaceae bacterium]|nr:rhomboid family intramembrane serine protease [Opitutaceae bacterium]
MSAEPPAAESDLVFTVAYEKFTGTEVNFQFKGTGELRVRPGGPSYTFSGRPRRFLPGGHIERVFQPSEIAGVSVKGRDIRFVVRSWRKSEAERTFIFFCRDEKDAVTIAGLLPDASVSPPTPAQDFLARLDQSGGMRDPWISITAGLIAANVLSFVVLAAFFGAGWFKVESMRPYLAFAANNGAATTGGEWWRLLTAMFSHYGLVHLLLNMWALQQAGLFLEKLQGRSHYVLTYFGSGLAGGFASIVWHGDQAWSAGASGAVFGVYGAILGHMVRQKGSVPPAVFQSILRSSLAFGFYNLVYGFAHPAIDQAAHLGGAAAGFFFGWLLAMPLEAEARRTLVFPRLRLGTIALAVLIIGGVAATPRFDYRIGEEIAWEDAHKSLGREEAALVKRFDTATADLAQGRQTAVHRAWISSMLIPFYERWITTLESLRFAAGLRTETRRTMLIAALNTRLASLRRLVDGIGTDAPGAVRRFHLEDAAFAQEIEAIGRLNQPK